MFCFVYNLSAVPLYNARMADDLSLDGLNAIMNLQRQEAFDDNTEAIHKALSKRGSYAARDTARERKEDAEAALLKIITSQAGGLDWQNRIVPCLEVNLPLRQSWIRMCVPEVNLLVALTLNIVHVARFEADRAVGLYLTKRIPIIRTTET